MASGYDLSSKNPFRLMQGRLGVYDKRPFNPNQVELEGVHHQSTRLNQNGGSKQQERMILSKRRSLDHAVWNSYQGAEIIRVDAEVRKPVRALINPNKLKQDYDDKILSVGFEYNFQPGDVFEWVGTKTHWLIYLQDLTELAYFRGDIRKCSYEIHWTDEEGKDCSTYIAIRGPVETKIKSLQTHGLSIDVPNYSLNFLMPNTPENLAYFQRYAKFYLQGDYKKDICWRVERVDWLSTPGIIEVVAIEYYSNEFEDNIDEGVVGNLNVNNLVPATVHTTNENIVGEYFIRPKREYEYIYQGEQQATWSVDKKYPVHLEQKGKTVKLKWNNTFSGQFDLYYGDYKQTIVVESLF